MQAGDAATRQTTQLNGFELDVLSEINHDVFGYTTLAYQSDDADRIKVDRAFITWGDLDHQPWYVTAGQFYAPFGRYAAATVSSPMTKTMGRMKAKGALLGWAPQQGPYANVRVQGFVGHADVSKSSRSGQINHWGWNMNWQHRFAHGPSLKTGLVYTNQLMNASMFQDWLQTAPAADASMLSQDYPGWDAYARVTWHPFQWNTEWVSFKDAIAVNPTITKTALLGQKPHAMYTELRYNTKRPYPGMLAVGFARTWGVDALMVSNRSYFLTDNMNLWKNTLQTIEWRLDRVQAPSKQINRQIKCRFGVFF